MTESLILLVGGFGGFAAGFGLATWFWTNGRHGLGGEYVGAAIQLAEAVDSDVLVATRLEQFRKVKAIIAKELAAKC